MTVDSPVFVVSVNSFVLPSLYVAFVRYVPDFTAFKPFCGVSLNWFHPSVCCAPCSVVTVLPLFVVVFVPLGVVVSV